MSSAGSSSILVSSQGSDRKPGPESIGRIFAKVRSEYGFTARSFAAEIGVTETSMCRFEQGVPCSPALTVGLLKLLLARIRATEVERRARVREIVRFLKRNPDLERFGPNRGRSPVRTSFPERRDP